MVTTVTSNSGNVVARCSRTHDDARLSIADTRSWEGRNLHHLTRDTIGANGALFFLSQQVRPAVLPIAQLASGTMRSVNQNAERLRVARGWADHHLDYDGRLVELVCR